jgi:hypothetical protein
MFCVAEIVAKNINHGALKMSEKITITKINNIPQRLRYVNFILKNINDSSWTTRMIINTCWEIKKDQPEREDKIYYVSFDYDSKEFYYRSEDSSIVDITVKNCKVETENDFGYPIEVWGYEIQYKDRPDVQVYWKNK